MSEKRRLEDDENVSDAMRTKSRRIEPKIDKFPKILDGTYYKIVNYNNENDLIEAACVNCTSKTSTGNFHTHYARRHGDHADAVKNYCDENKTERKKVERPKLQSVLPFKFSLDPMKVMILKRLYSMNG